MNLPGLSRLWRSERSLRQVREAIGRGEAPDWAAHAADAGYADQSHFVRECKQVSGRTPAKIAQQARHDEADWFYRLSTRFTADAWPVSSRPDLGDPRP